MKKILVVDASKASMVMSSEIFKNHYQNVQIYTAFNAKSAIQKVEQTDFDIVVIDYELPDECGLQTAIQIKTKIQKPIFLTAFETPELLASLTSSKYKSFLDVQLFLRKPLHREAVISLCHFYDNVKKMPFINVKKKLTGILEPHYDQDKCLSNDIIRHFFSVYLTDSAFDSVKLGCFTSKIPLENNFFPVNKSHLEVLKKGQKVTLFLQDPYIIKSGLVGIDPGSFLKNITQNKIRDFKKVKSLILDTFSFNIIGEIISFNETRDTNENQICIQFENNFISKQLFDAILRGSTVPKVGLLSYIGF